jgi:hypothetical protein
MSKENFVKLAKELEALDDQRNAKREELEAAMKELGVDSYARDPQTGAVYKIIKPAGTFISFRDIDYKRTALEGERGGTVLAKKEAEEAIAKGLV